MRWLRRSSADRLRLRHAAAEPGQKTIGRLLGDADFSGTHERAPDGFLIAYGTAVEPGRRQRGSIVDVTPTVLYFLGLPVARDMDGFARADLFNRAFTAERPIVSFRPIAARVSSFQFPASSFQFPAVRFRSSLGSSEPRWQLATGTGTGNWTSCVTIFRTL